MSWLVFNIIFKKSWLLKITKIKVLNFDFTYWRFNLPYFAFQVKRGM